MENKVPWLFPRGAGFLTACYRRKGQADTDPLWSQWVLSTGPCTWVSGAPSIFYLQLCIIFLEGGAWSCKSFQTYRTWISSPWRKEVPICTAKDCYLQFLCAYFTLYYQFSSVAQSCPTLCDPMDCSMPGLSVHHHLPELAQTHVHSVSDAIQPSLCLSFPSPPAFNLCQHQGLFQWVGSCHQVAKVFVL